MAKRTAAPNLDLQRERFKQQMTRSALSRQTNISRKALLDIEQRRTRVRLDTASRIAKALNVEITDVFELDEVIG
jgi:DNA-binding XRE family transcriptional regulator